MKRARTQQPADLPVQELLQGEYVHILRLHKNLNNLSTIPHRHHHYELFLSTHGNGRHSIDFKPYDVIPNRLFFLHKGQVHLMENFERDGWLIIFGEELFKRFVQIHQDEVAYGLLNAYTQHPYIDLDEKLKAVFMMMHGQIRTELDAEKQDVDLLLHYVSILLLHVNKAHLQQHPNEQLSSPHRHLFQQFTHLLEQQYTKQHLASFYAEALHMDIKKLNRICREATGLTVFELLQERLLTESKIQLQTSALSVKELSYQLGFNDPAFFGRFFKKHTGYTPAAFRNLRTL